MVVLWGFLPVNNANINNEECTHTCTPSTDVNATYFVGLISGLLPNRNDGRSSAIVPFRRRNISVRSNPAGQDYNALLDLNKRLHPHKATVFIRYLPVISRGRSKTSENLRSSTLRGGHEPSRGKQPRNCLCWVQMFIYILKHFWLGLQKRQWIHHEIISTVHFL